MVGAVASFSHTGAQMNAVTRINWLLRLARLCRLLAHICKSWKLLAMVAYALLDDVPHVRIQDKYGHYPHRYQQHRTCTYLGNRGFIYHDGLNGIGCPLLMMHSPSKRKFYE